MVYTAYGSGGGEAIDIALKTARHATQKKKIISIVKAYHGHTGLALKTGDDRFSKLFLSEDTQGEFVQVPFNDLNAMEEALRGRNVAAVIMETIPATYGFPMPAEGYLPTVKKMCERYHLLGLGCVFLGRFYSIWKGPKDLEGGGGTTLSHL